MKISSLFIGGALLLVGIGLAPVRPAEATIATCPGDYYSFILTARSAGTRKQSFHDFTHLGYCQLNDILTLEAELDTVRDNFRTAANSCGDTTEYKTQYNEVLMEEYFVRNIQKSKSDVLNEVDEEKLKAAKAAKLATLKSEMSELFVNSEHRVDSDTFDSYFTNWSSKYDDRIANYTHCEEGQWAELKSVWLKFVDDINALNIDVKKNDSSMSFDFSATSDFGGDQSKKDMGGEGKTTQNPYDYLQAKKEQQEAKVSSKQSAKEVAAQQALNFQEAIKQLNSGDQTFSIQTNAADRMANYELLYGAGSAVAATDMQSVVVYMNQILEQSNTKDFPNVTKSASKVYDKECH